MQGALSLDEALRRPLDLCPICLRKLQHLLGFKLVERYKVRGVSGAAGLRESERPVEARTRGAEGSGPRVGSWAQEPQAK